MKGIIFTTDNHSVHFDGMLYSVYFDDVVFSEMRGFFSDKNQAIKHAINMEIYLNEMKKEKQDEQLSEIIEAFNNSGDGIIIPPNLNDDEFVKFIEDITNDRTR